MSNIIQRAVRAGAMPSTRIVLLTLLCTLTVATASAQETLEKKKQEQLRKESMARLKREMDRFALFNACRPMALWVDLSDDEERTGLTEEIVRKAAENRLQVARLRLSTEEMREMGVGFFASLSLNVKVADSSFTLSVEYNKSVTDVFGKEGLARTWHSNTAFTHGETDSLVMAILSLELDEFLVEYLRGNQEACDN